MPSNRRPSGQPDTYQGWVTWIKKGRSGWKRPIGYAASAWIDGTGAVCLQKHATVVVTFHPHGNITLAHGGWMTPVTRTFLARYSPIQAGFSKWRAYSPQPGLGTSEPRITKCRTCHGTGTSDYPIWRSEEDGGPTYATCWRCKGEGRTDYGSHPLVAIWDLPYATFNKAGTILTAHHVGVL